MTDETEFASGDVAPRGEGRKAPRDTHEPPAITRLGTVAELTLGSTHTTTDGTFPGSQFV